MNFDQWFRYYSDPQEPVLANAFAKAFLDHAVGFEESFSDWCKAEYEIYQKNPVQYEVPYTGILD
jgi:hypothetical protein